MSASILTASLLFWDLLESSSQMIHFVVNLSIATEMSFQVFPGFGDAFFDLVESAHHSIEVVIDLLFLSIDLISDVGSIWKNGAF